jgi:hypothetical protein
LEECVVVLEKDYVELPCNLRIWVIRVRDEGLLYIVILGVVEVDGISIVCDNYVRAKRMYGLGCNRKL